MNLSTRIILHAFLQKCPPPQRQLLLKYLSPDLKEAIVKLPKTEGDPLKSQEDPSHLLGWIHTSWISPFLRTLSEREISFFLSCLNHEKALSVGKELLYTGALPSLSPLGKAFLQTTLVRYLTAEMDDLLPLECLPESPLNGLIKLPIDRLAHSFDLMGLHDLSVEIKQIIDRQKLSKVYDTLNEHQTRYLKNLLRLHEPVVFTSMGLLNWNGDQEKLKLLIRQRGANRLAKALYGQDSSLVWYVLHRFDMEKALLLRKLSLPIDNPRIAQLLIQQVTDFIHFNKESYEPTIRSH